MKRIAIKLVVFLLLGATVNVGVAWGCALVAEYELEPDALVQSESDESIDDVTIIDWLMHWPASVGSGSYNATWRDNSTRIGDEPEYRYIERHGWPAASMWCEYESVVDQSRSEGYLRALGALTLSRYGREKIMHTVHPVALPLRVVWPSFLINTVFYAVTLWLLRSAPFAARRLIRKRRGRCMRCGYDLRHAGHELCPECGAQR